MKPKEAKRFLKGFVQVADPKIWIASTVPMVVGGALAYGNTGQFSLYWFLVSLAGIYLIETGKNAVNEVVDFKSGVDRFVTPDKRTPFSGGKKAIVDGNLTLTEAKIISIITLGLSALIGLYITYYREPFVIWIGLLGLFFAIFYSLPPLSFAYRGLGEFVVGLTFGPLIMSGIYLVMTHSLDVSAVLTSLPIGFLIANVLWINQYPDYEADKKGNKLNCVVKLGKKNGLTIYKMLFICTYICFILLAVYYKNVLWLLGFTGLPISYKAVKTAKKHYNNIPRLVEANAKTIMIYQITGIIMVIASLSNKFFF